MTVVYTSMSPDFGSAMSHITITGSGFMTTPVTEVRFGGDDPDVPPGLYSAYYLAGFTIVNDTTLDVQVPTPGNNIHGHFVRLSSGEPLTLEPGNVLTDDFYATGSGGGGTPPAPLTTSISAVPDSGTLIMVGNMSVSDLSAEILMQIPNTSVGDLTSEALLFGPDPPTGLGVVVVSSSELDVSWTPSAGAITYDLKRSTSHLGPYTTIVTQAGTSYNDTGRTPSTTYYYVVDVTTAVGTSYDSAEASAKTDAIPFGAMDMAGN